MIGARRCPKRTAIGLLALGATVFFPARSGCEIQEVADAGGKVIYYKYTDKNGSVVFTDLLAKIPEEYRRKNKVVRIGPPPKEAAPVEQKEPGAPSVPEAPARPLSPVPPDARPPPGDSPRGHSRLIIVLAIAAALAGVIVYRFASAKGRQPPRGPGNFRPGREQPAARRVDPARERGKPPAERDRQEDSGRSPAREKPQEILNRLLQARDFSAAASLCEAQGDLQRAAGYHRESGNLRRAREIYRELKDYRQAAELAEKAGEELPAAELYEAAFQREDHDSRAASGNDNALKSGRLFEQAGVDDRAAAIYLQAGLFAEAAALFESGGDFLQAAANHLKAGNAEKAAECFEKGGDPVRGYAALSRSLYDKGQVTEAAVYAEKTGDLVQAATMFQEAGDLAKAGELFFQAGSYEEAGESFSLVNDPARAAEAYERAGKYLQAAQAFEKVGADKEKLATLYEKGEDYYSAGRFFVKLGQMERALHALQQVDVASPHHPGASLLVGMIFLKRGQTNLAYEKFLTIINNQPLSKANLEPYYFLALCYEQAGDAQNAKAIFARILAEDYNYRDVRKRVAQPPAQG